MWFLELTFSDLRQRGVEFICVSSITSAPDSVQSFLNWAALLDDHVRYGLSKPERRRTAFRPQPDPPGARVPGTYDPDHLLSIGRNWRFAN